MLKADLEKSWQARYERWATIYDEEHRIAGWSSEGLSRRLSLVLRLISKAGLKAGSLVLDVGAGPGTYTRAIHNMGHNCFGLDYSRKVIEVAKRKGERESYVQGEAYYLPFQDGAFEAVVCIGVLQSLETPAAALKEINRVLVPGGHLFLDGLNSLFWLHKLRRWKESLKGKKKKMSYYNPHYIQGEAERAGFSEARLHWLAVPEFFQRCVNHPWQAESYLAGWLVGHAFLLQAQKNYRGECADYLGK